jgi:hypothetical protein
VPAAAARCAQHGIDADDVYLVGSIGTTVDSAHSFLGTDTDDVYVTTTKYDAAHVPPLVDLYGTNPSDPRFNAQVLPSDVIDGPIDSHTVYLQNPGVRHNIHELLSQRRP